VIVDIVVVTRRELLRMSALAGIGGAAALAVGRTAVAAADTIKPGTPGSLGVLLDYAAGVISAADLKAAGAVGAIRYVSDRRPDGQWMLGKPIQASEATDLTGAGMQVVSNYQFGKGTTSDWLGGQDAGIKHAQRGVELHKAAGGPDTAPIYVSIDDNPSADQIANQVIPYIKAWESVIGHPRVGVYANSPTIDKLVQAGLGSFYWQHGWGTPQGYVHPAAHIRQSSIDSDTVGGVGVDINDILKPQYGQWSAAGNAAPPAQPGEAQVDSQVPGSLDDPLVQQGIQQGMGLAQQLLGSLTQQ